MIDEGRDRDYRTSLPYPSTGSMILNDSLGNVRMGTPYISMIRGRLHTTRTVAYDTVQMSTCTCMSTLSHAVAVLTLLHVNVYL